jgi:hypothetical protein
MGEAGSEKPSRNPSSPTSGVYIIDTLMGRLFSLSGAKARYLELLRFAQQTEIYLISKIRVDHSNYGAGGFKNEPNRPEK